MIEGMKKCVSLCLLKSGNSFLLIKRGKSKTKKEDDFGMYIPIGGKIEPYETPEEAAKREVFEETGYNIDNLEFKGIIIDNSKTKYNWVDFVYLSEVFYFEPKETNEGYLEWININEIDSIQTPEIDREMYKYIINNQKFIFNNYYDENINLYYSKEELSGIVIVDREKV